LGSLNELTEGATFDRALWSKIGQTIGSEARGLNNMRVGPLYFLDPDINLLRDQTFFGVNKC
jgi:hypothetical protein